VILPTLVVSWAHCVKVVDKAITMGNLRSLSTSKRLQCATPTAYIFYDCKVDCSIFINSKLNAQYLASYRLIG